MANAAAVTRSPEGCRFCSAPSTMYLYVPHDRNDNGPTARFYVTLQMEDLLPGPQNQFSILNGNAERGSEHSRLQMRMAVAVMPCLFVPVVAAGREQFVQNSGQVLLETGFEFNGADAASAADIEDVCHSNLNA